MRDVGSSAGFVSVLARPAPGQWNGMKRVSGRIVEVRRAGASTRPRRDVTATTSPCATPIRPASRGCSSTNAPGAALLSSGTRRVWAPDWYWATTRPVVRYSGYSASGSSAAGRCVTGTNRARPSSVANRSRKSRGVPGPSASAAASSEEYGQKTPSPSASLS